MFKCYDHKTHTLRAVKVIRNKKRFEHQALVELSVLQNLRRADADGAHHVIHLMEHFTFRSHLCLTFELLSNNLYEFLKHNNFAGLSLNLIRRFAHQLLVSLRFLRALNVRRRRRAAPSSHPFLPPSVPAAANPQPLLRRRRCSFPTKGLTLAAPLPSKPASNPITPKKHPRTQIIHCDLKPENVLLVQPNRSAIKVIDFGSSCMRDRRVYTYIQSRFYRSPEVILGLAYGTEIDMWSFACILAELYTGARTLFTCF